MMCVYFAMEVYMGVERAKPTAKYTHIMFLFAFSVIMFLFGFYSGDKCDRLTPFSFEIYHLEIIQVDSNPHCHQN